MIPKQFLRPILITWLVMFGVSILTNGATLYESYKHQWDKDVTLYRACHDIDYMKRNANDCAYIFNNVPWGLRYCLNFFRDTLVAADKCGVPCSDLFTLANILKFGVLRWMVDDGYKQIPKWYKAAKNKYMDYKIIQLRKNN